MPRGSFYAKLFGTITLTRYFLNLSLIFLFGQLTLANVRKQRKKRRLTPQRQIDRQLIAMLLFHVLGYVMLASPYTIMLLLSTILRRTNTLIFIQNLSRISLNLGYVMNFPIYVLSARLYRQEFFHALNKISNFIIKRNIVAIRKQQSHTTDTYEGSISLRSKSLFCLEEQKIELNGLVLHANTTDTENYV
ncbi:unnamed protein product [Didymodactylos carnosus]|uniref:G-protein coupled receptors family 1 profile domain-containing protein n=1 Tax=Didymodactylos carnosus TaxID=1234261 RepID=A0A815X304_9BILA|nr:unnamed protein product [Didymodactylos carnosus]CAF1552541.1 unnamed protein product [Didymodactylos carnosus]CAF4331845.1 unnamed protein product [Didymodactylos carnosus]CAF4413652.1 unnamed protein product [Didymodactylos carnosus]